MKKNNLDFGSSREELSNLVATVIRCLITISMLTFLGSESFAVFASQRPSTSYFAASRQRDAGSRTPGAKTANHDGPPQDQDRTKNKEQQPPSDMTNMLRTLTLG